MPYIVQSEDSLRYTCVLLHPFKPLLFLGTNHGCVEVYNLIKNEKRAELRYLVVNEFGEQIPVEDPVVNLAAPDDFQLVYAFMGIAAYCIDVELLTIVEKIPISERVVSGNVSPYHGEIAVITEPGYLSRWSPKFVERVASVEFPFRTLTCYLCHDYDERRVILVFEDGKILLTNLEDENYTVELKFPKAAELLDSIWYDRSKKYHVVINSSGNVQYNKIGKSMDGIPDNHILVQGKQRAEDKLRQFVTNSDTSESKREYITDSRFLRQSRDRYIAEIDALDASIHYQPTIEEDSKTLFYAIEDLDSDDLDQVSRASNLIEKISTRNGISPRYLLYAYRNRIPKTELIEKSRYFEFEAYWRKKRTRQMIFLSLLLNLLLLILIDTLGPSTLTLFVIVGFGLIISLTTFYWSNINKHPKIPGVREFRLIRISSIVALIFSIGWYILLLDILSFPFE